jgi:ArsR family metal-binding transcriptional regulator
MLIETYNLDITVSNHSAEEFEYEAIAYLPVDIAQVLPYLNATLRNGEYLPHVPAFSWKKDNNKIGFWPDKIAVDHLDSREQAEETIRQLVDMVNDTWERRGEIQPDSTSRENLQPLELYRLLPKTNCKMCGESSCFSFALKLAAGQVKIRQCAPLYAESEHEEKKTQLESLLATKRTLL